MTDARRARRHGLIASLLIVGALAAAAVYAGTRPIAKNFGVVEEGRLYRAGAMTPASLERVQKEYGVRMVIDLGGHIRGSEGDLAEQRAAREMGIERHVFRLEGDATGNPNAYVAALRLLADESKGPVLVHCAAGAQRTSALVVLYHHLIEGRPIIDVYPESFEYGHEPGDDWRLLAYLAEHGGEIERAFRQGGWAPGFPVPEDDTNPPPLAGQAR